MMIEEKFMLEENQLEFINQFNRYGFSNRSELLRTALQRLQQDLEQEDLIQSASLYAELYETDDELKELTESALLDLPE